MLRHASDPVPVTPRHSMEGRLRRRIGRGGEPRRRVLRLAVVVAVALSVGGIGLASSGCEGDAPQRHVGGPGYGCYFDTDCLGALVCAQTTAAEFPVCTGYGLEGDGCDEQAPCAWVRDDRGLPLACDAGVCVFPPDDRDI